jgi:flagellar protein FliO/FliZ
MPFAFTDALRRLPVVVGCVVLAAAHPTSCFADSKQDTPRSPDTVIYPKTAAEHAQEPATQGTSGGMYSNGPVLIFAILLAGTGGWILWKKRGGDLRFGGTPGKKLQVEETKSLGNRQYLVVASYEGRKFLLGVTTDRIELLTHLPDNEEGE